MNANQIKNTMKTQSPELSDLQQQALERILHWYYKTNDQFFVLAGYAGTGKSTLSREIARNISNCAFAAYTGKAAHVLRTKGAGNACTIHGLLYQYAGRDEDGKPLFDLKDVTSNGLVIIDEYSMIDRAMIEDILSKCNRVLFIGDPAQLPPIKEKTQVLTPDIFLEEIHRQAADNPIVKWAHEIRNGNVPLKPMSDGNFVVMRKDDVDEAFLDTVEQTIVGKNVTKHAINKAMREFYGFAAKSDFPVRGDKMICTKNNQTENLYNGYTFVLEADTTKSGNDYKINVRGKEYLAWGGDIRNESTEKYNYFSKLERFEYAYAITCHKSQGSEFDSVAIFNEAWGLDRINWLYTAVTRAKEQCYLLI